MSNRKNINTKINDIVDYWLNKIDETNLSVDATEADERCWRCGYKSSLEKCHIIPHSLGGSDEPSNLVLLCARCHVENPNVTDPEIMWDWIKAYKVPFYDTFWTIKGMDEYKKIYKKSIQEELVERNLKYDLNFENLIQQELENTSFHFGQSYLNSATIAGLYRMVIKNIDKKLQY